MERKDAQEYPEVKDDYGELSQFVERALFQPGFTRRECEWVANLGSTSNGYEQLSRLKAGTHRGPRHPVARDSSDPPSRGLALEGDK